MTGEHTITRQEWERCFRGEHDALTHQAYEIGDAIVRCSNCHRIIKAEFVEGCCPLCGSSPFTSIPVITQHVTIHTPQYYRRSENCFGCLLALSGFLSVVPLLFDGSAQVILKYMFGLSWDVTYFVFLGVTAIASVILALWEPTRTFWIRNRWGPVLLGIPILTPYAVLLCIWAVIGIAYVMISLLMIAVVIGIMCAFIAGLSEL